ncbi:MAG: hypothetical protein IJ746_02410 [Ruminococcus sp.]|nr:hypothetical protein [Ruminococcus sp.]
MSRKTQSLVGLCTGLGLGIFLLILEGAEWYIILPVVVIVAVIVIFAFVKDRLDSRRLDRLEESISTGERYRDEKWRSKQQRYLAKHGFREPRISMARDLLWHTQELSGLWFMGLGLPVLAVFLIIYFSENDLTALIFGVVCTAALVWYGWYRFRSPKLRRLIADLEQHPKFDVLNEAYMRGRTISRKRSGLNLGAGIVTLFTPKALVPITFNEVREVSFYVEHRLNYTNGLYSDTEHHFYVRILAGDDQSVKEFPIELGEQAAVEAVEQLARAGLPVKAEALGLYNE